MKALWFCLLALTACGQSIEPAPKPGEIYNIPEIEWNVLDREQLAQVYRDSGMDLRPGDDLHGFAGKRGNTVVIYTLAPKTVDDQATLTLGHEVLHVVLGEYH